MASPSTAHSHLAFSFAPSHVTICMGPPPHFPFRSKRGLFRSLARMLRRWNRALCNFVRTKRGCGVIALLLWILFARIRSQVSTPNLLILPNQTAVNTVLWKRESEFAAVKNQCKRLLREDPAAIAESKRFKLSNAISGFSVKNCLTFLSRRLYFLHTATTEERDFPIAFSILVHTSAPQVERLLRAIYVPHNLYCIHVDANAATEMHEAMASVAGCLENVFVIPKPRNTMWGSIDLVKAELMCAELMLKKNAKWKYFINLTGHEFPLWSNRHLVRILKTFQGANDITASSEQIFPDRFKYIWRNGGRTQRKKSPPPGGLRMIRGTAHAIASRAFMEAVTTRPLAKQFLAWLEDTFVADEMFFPVLNHNPEVFPVSGGNPEIGFEKDPRHRGTVARLKEWFVHGVIEPRQCRGFLERNICIQGAGDLWKLVQAPELFVNKLMADRDPLGFRCAEWLHHQRLLDAYRETRFYFDTFRYAKLPFVRHHTS